MEKRLLLVFALTFLIIVAFQPLLKKYGPQPAPEKPAQSQSQPANTYSPPPTSASVQASPTVPTPGNKQAAAEAETVVENDLYRITFTNRGGLVKSWILKKFDDDHGRPLELVHPIAAPKYGYPLSLWSYDDGLRNKLNSVLYLSSGSGTLSAP